MNDNNTAKPSSSERIRELEIVIKSLIEKDNKFYFELSLNHCLYEI